MERLFNSILYVMVKLLALLKIKVFLKWLIGEMIKKYIMNGKIVLP